MDEIKQSQKAGEGANQFQAGTVTVNNTFVGITEQRAREIFYSEMVPMIRALAVEAQNVATKRMLDLFSDLMARVKKCEKDLSSFSDPGFLQNLRVAQESAAVSERKEDIETLSELLIDRMNGNISGCRKTGIRRAMEVVPELEECELVVLAVMFFSIIYTCLDMSAINVEQYLSALDGKLASILSICKLPYDTRYLQHLSILDCVEINHASSFRKLEDYYAEEIDGIICAGVAKGSPEHQTVMKILDECDVGYNVLVANDLLPGYDRLPLVQLNYFSNLTIPAPDIQHVASMAINKKNEEGLRKAISLYERDDVLLKKVKDLFARKMDKYDSIRQFRYWLARQDYKFELTPIGEALAYAIIRRCIPDMPTFILN